MEHDYTQISCTELALYWDEKMQETDTCSELATDDSFVALCNEATRRRMTPIDICNILRGHII